MDEAQGQQGPVDESVLYQLLIERAVVADTLVWCKGMEQWQPANEVDAFCDVENQPPPLPVSLPLPKGEPKPEPETTSTIVEKDEHVVEPPPLPSGRRRSISPLLLGQAVDIAPAEPTTSIDVQEVHPWYRYWARNCDLITFLIVFSLVITYTPLGILYPDDLNKVINSLISVAFYIPVEALSLACFGTTLGKRIFKIVVVKDDRKLTFNEALERVTSIYFRYGLAIPLVRIYTQVKGFQDLKRLKLTKWDQRLNITVKSKKLSYLRVIIGLSVTVFLMIIYVALTR